MIHDSSIRAKAPFVDLNCAGLSRDLLESELFGHEKGSFTDASTTKPGLFEIAAHGTVFLDEIGELEPSIQARLLKALEEKRFRRVGGVRDINVDMRLIAATNRDIAGEEQQPPLPAGHLTQVMRAAAGCTKRQRIDDHEGFEARLDYEQP